VSRSQLSVHKQVCCTRMRSRHRGSRPPTRTPTTNFTRCWEGVGPMRRPRGVGSANSPGSLVRRLGLGHSVNNLQTAHRHPMHCCELRLLAKLTGSAKPEIRRALSKIDPATDNDVRHASGQITRCQQLRFRTRVQEYVGACRLS